MSDRRRRRRSESGVENELAPPRWRRYYTRSAVRDFENRMTLLTSRWNSSSGSNINVMRIPFVDFSRYPGRSQTQPRNTRRTRDPPARAQASTSRTTGNGSSASFAASTSGTHNRSWPRAGEVSRGVTTRGDLRRWRQEQRNERQAETTNRQSPRSSQSRLDYLHLVRRIRTYAAMSTGGPLRRPNNRQRSAEAARSGVAASTSRSRSSDTQARRSGARLMRPTTSHDRPSGSGETRPPHSRPRRVANEDFNEMIRSLNLVPRETLPTNILRALESQRRAESLLFNSQREQEHFVLTRMMRDRQRPDTNRTGVRTRAISNIISNNDNITYNMTPNRSGVNISVAFGADEEISGDSDVTTYLNSVSDAEMSTDDVFYSDTDRMESDSGESVESASTATPHSLVSLSLNALNPSPTPSVTSVDTDDINDDDDEMDDDDSTPIVDRAIITSMRNAGNPIIFMRNNITVQFLATMAELADVFTNIRTTLRNTLPAPGTNTENATDQEEGFTLTPVRFNQLEPTRRRVPEGVDCQRAKLIDELNSNTAECVICTDAIQGDEQVWPCNNCFNIFHLPCIRRWAKTNRDTEMGGAWICPVCRRPKFCSPNKLRYRCLCGRRAKPKPLPGVTPHCCGKRCKHNCGLLCHPGPCKMTEAETAAVTKGASTSQAESTPQSTLASTSGETSR